MRVDHFDDGDPCNWSVFFEVGINHKDGEPGNIMFDVGGLCAPEEGRWHLDYFHGPDISREDVRIIISACIAERLGEISEVLRDIRDEGVGG